MQSKRSADLKLDSALHSPLGFQSLTNWRSTAPAEVPSFNHSPIVQLPPGCRALRLCQVVSRDRAILSTPHRKPPATAAPAGLQVRTGAAVHSRASARVGFQIVCCLRPYHRAIWHVAAAASGAGTDARTRPRRRGRAAAMQGWPTP
eukprot:scaffold3013_cov59-Phaeocystis_antarctica.AAC.1